MRLAPRDVDKLLLHNAGFLAQKRLARGVRLNYPEAVAIIRSLPVQADVMLTPGAKRSKVGP